MAQCEAPETVHYANLEAIPGLLGDQRRHSHKRASSCEQNWTNLAAGVVGLELHCEHWIMSFETEETAQTRLLTLEERALETLESPFLGGVQ